jgi:lipoate-protein ligase A
MDEYPSLWKWNFINSGFNTGAYNMRFDLELATACKEDEAFFRLYRWEPYCISLGANQKFEDINLDKTSRNGIDVVKRPTGGRAILHAEEITYSVVYPLNGGLTPSEIYRKISIAIAGGLTIYNSELKNVELENIQQDFIGLLKEPQGLACFAGTAKSEVKWNGMKLVGSAQRKMDKIILQHGSILCGNYHLKIVDYLNLPEKEIQTVKEHLRKKTIDLESILNIPTDYEKLSLALIEGFEKEWNIELLGKAEIKGEL